MNEQLSQHLEAIYTEWKGGHISAYHPLYDDWLIALEVAGPEALEAALSLLPAFDAFDGRYYLEALDQRFPEALPDAVTEALMAGMSRPAPMGKRSGWGARETLSWAAEAGQRSRYTRALVLGLVDRLANARELLSALRAGGDAAIASLITSLTHEDSRQRRAAASALEQLAPTGAADALRAALAAEEEPQARQALGEALAAVAAAGLDVDAFPETEAGDAELSDALAALPPFSAPPPPAALTWARGGALSDAATAWFAAALNREDRQRRCVALPEVQARLDDASCQALLRSRTWPAPRFASAMLSSEAAIEKSALNPGEDGVEALARAGTPAAIRRLDHIRDGTPSLRWMVDAVLERLATEREMDVEELLDSAVSTFDFDRHAERVMAFGDRAVTLRLSVVNKMEYLDADGKRLVDLPSARKGEVTAFRALKREVSALKKTIKRIQTTQQKRLADALTSQRTWPGAPWRRRFVVHPLMYAFSRSLIWEALPADGGAPRAFAVSDDGDLVDTDWDEVALNPGDRVRLLHPVRLSDDERAAWRQVLDDQEALQPFPQLARVVFPAAGLPPDDPDDNAPLFTGWPKVLEGKFTGVVRRRKAAPSVSGQPIHLRVGRYDFTIARGSLDKKSRGVAIAEMTCLLDGDRVSRRALPPLILSEVFYLMHIACGAEGIDDEG